MYSVQSYLQHSVSCSSHCVAAMISSNGRFFYDFHRHVAPWPLYQLSSFLEIWESTTLLYLPILYVQDFVHFIYTCCHQTQDTTGSRALGCLGFGENVCALNSILSVQSILGDWSTTRAYITLPDFKEMRRALSFVTHTSSDWQTHCAEIMQRIPLKPGIYISLHWRWGASNMWSDWILKTTDHVGWPGWYGVSLCWGMVLRLNGYDCLSACLLRRDVHRSAGFSHREDEIYVHGFYDVYSWPGARNLRDLLCMERTKCVTWIPVQ